MQDLCWDGALHSPQYQLHCMHLTYLVCLLLCLQAPDGTPGRAAVSMELRKLKLYSIQVWLRQLQVHSQQQAATCI